MHTTKAVKPGTETHVQITQTRGKKHLPPVLTAKIIRLDKREYGWVRYRAEVVEKDGSVFVLEFAHARALEHSPWLVYEMLREYSLLKLPQ